MELTHGKSWSTVALLLALVSLLLFYYGELYAVVGVFVSFMGLVLMSMIYINLYMLYEDSIIREESRERTEMLNAEMASLIKKVREEENGKQKTQ